MSPILNTAMAVIGIDIGKNSFHVVGLGARGATVLRHKRARSSGSSHLPTVRIFDANRIQWSITCRAHAS
jgi:hypothetical protein